MCVLKAFGVVMIKTKYLDSVLVKTSFLVCPHVHILVYVHVVVVSCYSQFVKKLPCVFCQWNVTKLLH